MAVLFSTNVIWTQSLNTLPTDSRPITYEKLGVFAKYVAYKQQVEPLLDNYETELKYADSLMEAMREKNRLAQDIIANLKAENQSKDIRLANGSEILKVTEDSFKAQMKAERKRKWNWGAFGIIIGGAVGFLTAISL